MTSEFSKKGQYLAQINVDGKLKIWDTSSNVLQVEYTPNLHLNQPCTCLKWLEISNQGYTKKKKRRSSEEVIECVALGTKNGTVLIFSPSETKIITTLGSDNTAPIECLDWDLNTGLLSSSASHVTWWNIHDGSIKSKWKVTTQNEKVNSMLIIGEKYQLVTASRTIKLWDMKEKKLLKSFTGHTSDINLLKYIPPDDSSNAGGYLLSAAKVDRILNCWNLNENSNDKNSIANFIMDDYATQIHYVLTQTLTLAIVQQIGYVQIYHQKTPGKSDKSIKSKVTLQIANEKSKSNNEVTMVPILSAFLYSNNSILLGYGSSHMLNFENISFNLHEKNQCLIRTDPSSLTTKKIESNQQMSKKKLHSTEVNEREQGSVAYLTKATLSKRKLKDDGELNYNDVPMEKRLENLLLSKPNAEDVTQNGSSEGGSSSDKVMPKTDNMANLLIQGLHSGDTNMMNSVFMKKEDSLIRNTLRRMPVEILPKLFGELTNLVQAKTTWSQNGALWLTHLVKIHGSQLIANPSLNDLVSPVLCSVQTRLELLPQLLRLKGRLDLITSQLKTTVDNTDINFDEYLAVYQDPDSNDENEENLMVDEESDVDDHWDEGSTGSGEAGGAGDKDEDDDVVEMNSVHSDSDSDDVEMSN